MRFIDEAIIQVSAGHGGRGSVSFKREAFMPKGGPDGGDGGQGGHVFFRCNAQRSTLQDFRYKRVYRAPNGESGRGGLKAGPDGNDVTLEVPPGTLIKDAHTDDIIHTFETDGEVYMLCRGGRGGKGNSHFKSSVNQTPRYAQPGEAGEFKDIKIELKLLADAAIIGYPNAGKSSLIARMSAARPKIADYAFTTLTPNLGVVSLGETQSYVVADIPGLIEGAHAGLGLGHRFLKHVEKARVLVHLIDLAYLLEALTNPKDEDPVSTATEVLRKQYLAIRNELSLFNEDLLNRPELVVFNKMELFEHYPDWLNHLQKEIQKLIGETRHTKSVRPDEPLMISCATGANINELIPILYHEVRAVSPEDTKVLTPEKSVLFIKRGGKS